MLRTGISYLPSFAVEVCFPQTHAFTWYRWNLLSGTFSKRTIFNLHPEAYYSMQSETLQIHIQFLPKNFFFTDANFNFPIFKRNNENLLDRFTYYRFRSQQKQNHKNKSIAIGNIPKLHVLDLQNKSKNAKSVPWHNQFYWDTWRAPWPDPCKISPSPSLPISLPGFIT